jgi:hypothetical protein
MARGALVLLLALFGMHMREVHGASRQPAKFSGRRLLGPTTAGSESRALIKDATSSAARSAAKLLDAATLPASSEPKVGSVQIGGFEIPHISQQVRFGEGALS